MTTQERADKIYKAYMNIKSTYEGDVLSGNASIMVHSLTNLQELDKSWNLDVLRTMGGAIITAKKDGVTLFGTL